MSAITDKMEAENKARELYDEYFDRKEAMWTCEFSTDLNKILNGLNLTAIKVDLNVISKKAEALTGRNDVAGCLLKDGNDYTIFVNESDYLIRQRFTIAHELGHYKLNHLADKEISISYRDSQSSVGRDPEEKAANAFAAELLMPAELIEHVYNMTESIYKTAKAFTVSERAVEYRLKRLGVITDGGQF